MTGNETDLRQQTGDTEMRGASPVIGLIILFALVMVGALLVFAVGSSMFDALESEAYAEKTEQSLKQFDSDVTSLKLQNDTSNSVHLGEELNSEVKADGELTVTVSDGYVSRESDSIRLQTIVATDNGGNEFAYQAGGIWRLNGDQATVVSEPDLRYYTEVIDDERVGRIDVSPTTVDGNVGSGEHRIREYDEVTFDSFDNDLAYVNYVTIEVSNSSYHSAWYSFLEDEFDATDEEELSGRDCENPTNVERNIICHDKTDETVTVVAAVDGETPLANLVDIDPTVYGGLYIEGHEDDFRSSLTVRGYDEHDAATNVSPDLFLANYDTYNLHNHANIAGVPVVNGELGSKGNPEISRIGYGVSVNEGPHGERFDEEADAYWLDAHKQALATELSSPYGDIEPITGKIDDLRTNYLTDGPTAGGTVTAGLYDGVSTEIRTLDSSSGNVHIGVNGDLDLSDVNVTGDNQTSIYVDGDVTVSDVKITPSDRANSLWIYATEGSTIRVADDFQGVIYAPGSELEIADETTIDGAVVAGDGSRIGDNVRINFDRTLRTDTPLSDEDEEQLFEYGDARAPIDATFVLDRSGSMGPHNTYRNTYEPVETVRISGDDWEPIPVTEPFRNVQSGQVVEVRNQTSGEEKRLEYHDAADPKNWDEINVATETCYRWWCTDHADLGLYEHPGNDPSGIRAEATKDFIGLMNESNGDRAGVYDFNDEGSVLHQLDSDLDAVRANVVGNAYGGTNMVAGLKQAIDDYDGATDKERVTILLSDGQNSRAEYDRGMRYQIERAKNHNVTLYTIGLTGPEGGSIPEEKIEGWAEETGGNYYRVEDADELRDLFETIAKDEVEIDRDTEIEIAVTNDRETTSGYAISVSEQTVTIDS